MKTVTRVKRAMQEILVNQANHLAVETGFMERERVLTGSSFVSGLVSGWQANPQASLESLSQAIGNAGTPISRQGLAYRFDEKAVVFLKAVLDRSLEQMVRAVPVSDGLLSRFTSVDLVDSSIITLPNELQEVWRGSGGNGENARVSSLKLNVRLDVRSGQLKTLELSDGVQQDRHSVAWQQAVDAGSLQIADLGYFKLDDFERIAQQDAYWLSRYKTGTRVYDQQGQDLALSDLLPTREGQHISCRVQVGREKRLPCRLVAERLPQWVIDQREARLRETNRKKQQATTHEALELTQWTIYLTNLPPDLATVRQILVLGRYRWQIELLFKLWKSDLHLDQWTSTNCHRILSEIYGKLIAAVVTHWLLLVACWHHPRRSFRLAIHSIRALAWQIANSLHSHSQLNHVFRALRRATSNSNIGRARTDPRAWQLIYDDIA